VIHGEPRWQLVFTGTLADFIDNHHDNIADWCECEYSMFRRVTMEYGTVHWMNKLTAQQRLDDKYGPLGNLRIWSQHGTMKPGACNWDNQVNNLRAIVEAFPELNTDEIRSFLDAN
jgi:hypothetical protein